MLKTNNSHLLMTTPSTLIQGVPRWIKDGGNTAARDLFHIPTSSSQTSPIIIPLLK